MIYNYIKCESVIAKIMADLDSTEVRNRTSDIREWIFEAVDKIGAPMQYISKESGEDGTPLFAIQDNQIPIPADLVVLDGLAYSTKQNGPWIPMMKSTSLFKFQKKPRRPQFVKECNFDFNNKASEEDIVLENPIPEKGITSQSQMYTINTMKYINRMTADDMLHQKPEYFIKPGWIVTNKDKGFIKIAYKAIATDERGYPLIPDLSSYQEAIYWYVIMKMAFPKFMSGQLSGKGSKYAAKFSRDTYFYIQQQWNFYRNQAYAEAMMPTADDMKNIKNDWHKLIPDYEADDTFFKDINKEQITYNDYYHGY